MDLSDIALRAVGAFYAFAGVVATRAAITAALLDRAIAKISLEKISTREATRTWWLFAGAVLTFLGGLALAVEFDIAVWLFVLCAVGQAIYLAVLAPFYFDAAEPPDANGRRGTMNAFAIYLGATAFVLWAGQHGKLKSFEDAVPAAIAIAGTALAAYVWYLVSIAWRAFAREPLDGPDDDAPGDGDDVASGRGLDQ